MGDYLLSIKILRYTNATTSKYSSKFFYPGPMSRNNRDFVRDSTVANTCLS